MVTEFIGAALLFLLGIWVGSLLHKTKDKNIQNKNKQIQKNRDKKGRKGENLVKGILERQNIPYKDNFLFKTNANSSTEIDFLAMTSDTDLLFIEVKNWRYDHRKDKNSVIEQNERHILGFKKLLMIMDEQHRPKRFLTFRNIVVFVGEFEPEHQHNHFTLKSFEKYISDHNRGTSQDSLEFINNLVHYDISGDIEAVNNHINNAILAREISR